MYRCELFDMYRMVSKGGFLFNDDVEISFDYMSPRAISIPAPKECEAELRNTLLIYDEAQGTSNIYQGFVKDIERTDTKTVLTVAPLMMLFNEKSVQNVAYTDWARQLQAQIWWDFQQPTPSLYSVPWVVWGSYPYTLWGGVERPYGAELLNDMDCIINARKTYGKFMRFSCGVLTSNLGRPYFGFLNWNTRKVIEADLDNIIEKTINETTQGGYNIRQLWYPVSEGSLNYGHYDAVLINGVIYADGSRKNEITEPRLISKVTDTTSPDSDTRWSFFREMLKPQADNFEISLTVSIDDTLIQPRGMIVGRPVDIIAGGRTYSTHYTGFTRKGDLIVLRFGTVRRSLTSILNEEGL